MKALYQAILTKLSELVTNDTIKYRNVWNNQHQRILEDKPDFTHSIFQQFLLKSLTPLVSFNWELMKRGEMDSYTIN